MCFDGRETIARLWSSVMGILSPSLLSADFARLAESVELLRSAGVSWLHLDVMDGRFVPNITFGPPVVAALRRAFPRDTDEFPAVLDTHLMIVEPERYIDAFIDAGADVLTVHAESTVHLERCLAQIRERGCKAGVAFNPATPLDALPHVLHTTDLVLIMSVNPGFGGQGLIPATLDKIEQARKIIQASGRAIHLEVDGGVKIDNISLTLDRGADVIVAGSGVFGAPNIPERVRSFSRILDAHTT
jgi:ribulose-phosphate 3-epimerase